MELIFLETKMGADHSFHVGCARASDEQFFISINDASEPVAFCPKHVPEEHKKPKEPKKKGRQSLAIEGPEIKTISLREVLTDPVLVALKNKLEAVEEAKRQASKELSDKTGERQRNAEMRRKAQSERHMAMSQRLAGDHAEHAAQFKAMVRIPNNYMTTAFHQLLGAGAVLFVPSRDFLLTLSSDPRFWYTSE